MNKTRPPLGPTAESEQPRRDSPTRTLRRSLSVLLISVALLATLLLGTYMFFETRSVLTRSTQAQLTNQQRSQARAISTGLDSVGNTVSVIANDEGTIRALSDLAGAFRELDAVSEPLGGDETRALGDYYTTTVAEDLAAAGVATPASEAIPSGEVARYLQYHYVVSNPFPAGDREQLTVAPDDDSAYQAAHATHHPLLDGQRSALGFSDLLLIDADGNIVYTAEKRTDLGRNVFGSEFLQAALPTLIDRQLATAALGEPVFSDFDRYPPAEGAPTLFAAAALSGPDGIIGAVAVQVPIEALNRITTADGRWPEVGFGETGETYVVGRDLLLRSDSRLWLEDPEAYLATVREQYPPEVADSIARFGTTVLQQPAATDPVEAAFDGEDFLGRSSDYLGRSALAAAGRIDNKQIDWVLVAQIDIAEAGSPLGSYLRRMLILAAILVPLVAMAGILLAGVFTRPFRPVVEAAARIADGDLDVEIPDLGANELGDVARRLGDFARHLREQEEAIAEQERATTRLLLSALPPRLVERVRSGEEQIDDLVDSATVVAVTVTGLVEDPSIDADTTVELAALVSRGLEQAAGPLGLERVRSSSDQHVFVAGLGHPGYDADRAAEFAVAVDIVLEGFAEVTGLDPDHQVGICSGKVISGFLASDQLTYGVFGEPPQTALALCAIAAPGQILVHRSTADRLGEDWEMEAVTNLVDLRGDTIDASALMGRAPAPQDGQSTAGDAGEPPTE